MPLDDNIIDMTLRRELALYKKEKLSRLERWRVRNWHPVFVILPHSRPLVHTIGWTDWLQGNSENDFQVFFLELDRMYSVYKGEVREADSKDLKYIRERA